MSKNWIKRLTFNSDHLIPAVIQDVSGSVLTLCYMNEAALLKTIEDGYVHVYRRSLRRLMMKGETSGHIQKVVSLDVDCEGKSILIRVRQKKAGCHKGYFSCFFDRLDKRGAFKVNQKKKFDSKDIYGK